MSNIFIFGTGSFGTSLALLLNDNNHNIVLHTHKKENSEKLNKERENKRYLPGIEIAKNISITDNIEEIHSAEYIIMALPSYCIRENLYKYREYLNKKIVINVAKGLERKTNKRMSQVIEEVLPNTKYCILSGPSHAEEIARKLPTSCVIASRYKEVVYSVQDIFMNNYFRVYSSDDIIGVEMGGALKNVIALAAGICDGIGYGDNTKAALMTRGIKEIARLGEKMGACSETFAGLSGIGDLIATCMSEHSRNRLAGYYLGKGYNIEETIVKVNMIVEGINTSKVAYELSKEYKVNMPIISAIYDVLYRKKLPHIAVEELMLRNKKSEI